jgi:hypothetical protein
MRFSAPAPPLRHGSLRAPPSGLELRALLSEVRASTDRTQLAARRRLAAAGALALALVVMLAGSRNFDFLPNFVRADASRPYLPHLRGDSSRARAAGAPASESPKHREQIREESRMRVVQHALRGVTVGVSMGMALAAGSAAQGQNAVQWRVEDGGNGHWYALLPNAPDRVWSSAQADAASLSAVLASISSAEELDWILNGLASSPDAWTLSWGPFLGGVQAENSPDSLSGWSWLDGSPWFPAWGPSNCGADDSCLDQRWLGLGRCEATQEISFNDESFRGAVGQCGAIPARSALIEWSADCNADGIVDYGQILAGELEDANANNIPDCCEAGTPCDTCRGDIDESGAVNGVDLAAVLNNWGTNGGKYPRADINGDGTVDASDLAFVLSTWGACP